MKAIIAMSSNRCIGRDGKLPFYYKEDLKWFKEFTLYNTILIGRTTYEGLPPLKDRKLMVLSTKLFVHPSNILIVNNVKTALAYVEGIKFNHNCDVIVAGGKSIYELFMPYITEFYVTHIDKEYEGDTYMSLFEDKFSKKEIVKEFDFGRVIKYTN
jgi:dihydrofolate reductase